MSKSTRYIVHGAMIAALYVVLTFLANLLGMSSGVIQVRFSEMLTILPFFTPAAIPGLFVGCILANLLTGAIPIDILCGSLATLLGALGTYAIAALPKKAPLGKNKPWAKYLAPLPPILANTIIVPFVLAYGYGFEGGIPYFMLTVGIGEIISCGILGIILLLALKPYSGSLFCSIK